MYLSLLVGVYTLLVAAICVGGAVAAIHARLEPSPHHKMRGYRKTAYLLGAAGILYAPVPTTMARVFSTAALLFAAAYVAAAFRLSDQNRRKDRRH